MTLQEARWRFNPSGLYPWHSYFEREVQMATKTYSQLVRQIDKLKEEAEALRQREIKDVVARIREAIKHYQLTAADLGLRSTRGRKARPASKATSSKPKRTAGRIRYRDASGNSWTGRGRRPNWFVSALAAGATPESMEVR